MARHRVVLEQKVSFAACPSLNKRKLGGFASGLPASAASMAASLSGVALSSSFNLSFVSIVSPFSFWRVKRQVETARQQGFKDIKEKARPYWLERTSCLGNSWAIDGLLFFVVVC